MEDTMSMRNSDDSFRVEFPSYFDDDEPIIESKGYFADLRIVHRGLSYRPRFYTPWRLMETVESEFASGTGAFVELNLVIVQETNRAGIESAVAHLARFGLSGLVCEEAG